MRKSSMFAQLKSDSPVRSVFSDGFVPVKEVYPAAADLEGKGIRDVYMIDTELLTPDQVDRVLDFVTRDCPERRAEALNDLRTIGMPLQSMHVAGVAIDARAFL